MALPLKLGQKSADLSMPVVLASDTTVDVSLAGSVTDDASLSVHLGVNTLLVSLVGALLEEQKLTNRLLTKMYG